MEQLLGQRGSAPRRRLSRHGSTVVLSAVALFGATPWLLCRMRDDFRGTGKLRLSTTILMAGAYSIFCLLFGAALRAPRAGVSECRLMSSAGTGLAAAGAGLAASGTRRFEGFGQLAGACPGRIVTGGIYRYSRNPQYVGLVAFLDGLAVACGSASGVALVAGLATVYRSWVPVEEQHLEWQFGREYPGYMARTSRWFGPPAPARCPGPRPDNDRGI